MPTEKKRYYQISSLEKGIKMGIAALNMKDGFSIEDLEIPDYMEMLSVLKHEGNKYIIVSKVKILNKFIGFAKKFNIDIKWDTPSIFKKNKMIRINLYMTF